MSTVTGVVTVDYAVTSNSSLSWGFLHAFSPTQPVDGMLVPLGTTFLRSGAFTRYDRAISLGIRYQDVLSDHWGYPNGSTHVGALWPYQDPSGYSSFLSSYLTSHSTQTFLIDVSNEPDLAGSWGGTFQQFCDTYANAYRGLRAIYPTALIGGPSASSWSLGWYTSFLTQCLANNVQVNFLSWHETSNDPTLVVAHAAEARSLLTNPTYSSLSIQELQVNEQGGQAIQYAPACALQGLVFMEQSGLSAAVRTAWADPTSGADNGHNNSLDGTLTDLTSQLTVTPRGVYWAYAAYAQLGPLRSQTTVDIVNLTAIASSSSSNGALQVLIGDYRNQHSTETQCATSLALKNLNYNPYLFSATTLHITASSITSTGETAAPWAAASFDTLLPTNGSTVTVFLGMINRFDALQVLIVPQYPSASSATTSPPTPTPAPTLSWSKASVVLRDPWAQVSAQPVNTTNGIDFELRVTQNYPMRISNDRPLQITSGITRGGTP